MLRFFETILEAVAPNVDGSRSCSGSPEFLELAKLIVDTALDLHELVEEYRSTDSICSRKDRECMFGNLLLRL
jgi:hypothetical protein